MSNKKDSGEYAIVTEVGTFGDLNIADPSKKRINKEDVDIDTLIKQSIDQNKKSLSK